MRSVRIIDRGLAAAPVHDSVVRSASDPRRPSVEDRRSFYWAGPGWTAAFEEAKRLVRNGSDQRAAAASVGWTEQELKEAIERNGEPPALDPDAPLMRERPRRTVKQRVEGLHDISDKTLRLARRLYEIEIMTVREVSRAISEPYEKTYLILIKAGTEFRRPGRRKVRDPDPRPSEPDVPEPEVVSEPELRVKPKKPRKKESKRMTAVEKAVRRVLGDIDGGRPVRPTAAVRKPLEKATPARTRKPRRTTSDADKALRRVLNSI